jgi:hypothetical protein
MKCQIRRKNDLLLKRHFMQSRSFLLRNKFLPFISNCVIFWPNFLTNHSTENRSSVNSDRSKYFFFPPLSPQNICVRCLLLVLKIAGMIVQESNFISCYYFAVSIPLPLFITVTFIY